jgi:tripartite-type tricarboxylate transporter receptor subunit TctC
VPFKSGSESVNNILGGQVAMTLEALPVVLPHAASGKLKAVAIAAPARHASAPELKTTAELGYPAIRSSSLSGLIGPAGMVPEHVAKLNAAARKALESTEFKAKLFVQGSDAKASTPDHFVQLVRAEHAKWGKLLASSPKL